MSCQRVIDGRRVRRDVGSDKMLGRDDESCDIMRHHVIGSGSGSRAGGVRYHSTEGVAEERRGGGSGRQAGVGSGSRAIIGSVRGSPYRRRGYNVSRRLAADGLPGRVPHGFGLRRAELVENLLEKSDRLALTYHRGCSGSKGRK